MRYIRLFLLLFCLPTCLWAQQPLRPSKGAGTAADPFLIEALAHWRWLCEGTDMPDSLRWAAHYRLVADLDATQAATWSEGKGPRPIGTLQTPFTGTFDGGFHHISHLRQQYPSMDGVGFFGYTQGGTVRGLGIRDASVVGHHYVAILIGYAQYTRISACYISGVAEAQRVVGGILGFGGSVVLEYSYAFGAVKEWEDAWRGTLAGQLLNAEVSTCYAVANYPQFPGWDWSIVSFSLFPTFKFTYGDALGQRDGYGDVLRPSSYFADLSKLPGFSPSEWVVAIDPELSPLPRPYYRPFRGERAQLQVSCSPDTVAIAGISLKDGFYPHDTDLPFSLTLREGYVLDSVLLNGKPLDLQQLKSLRLAEGENRLHIALHIAPDVFAKGSGTPQDPYQIGTLKQLGMLSYLRPYWDRHFLLVSDLDAWDTDQWRDGRGFLPIGDQQVPFTGSFDGAGHRIAGLFSTGEALQMAGLFGHVYRAQITRIALEDARLQGGEYTGLVGYARESELSEFFVSGKLTNVLSGGALVGRMQGGRLSNSYSMASVYSGPNYRGTSAGMVGRLEGDAQMRACYMAAHTNVGWLPEGGSLVDCYVDWERSGFPYVSWNPTPGYLPTKDFATLPKGFSPSFWTIGAYEGVPTPVLRYQSGDQSYLRVYVDKPHGLQGKVEEGWYQTGALTPSLAVKYGYSDLRYVFNDVLLPEGTTTLELRPGRNQLRIQLSPDLSLLGGGDGSAQHPLQITTLAQLDVFSRVREYWDKHVLLTTDIDATMTMAWEDGKGFRPIGDAQTPFSGVFDGAGHTISGLTISRTEEDFTAFFGRLAGAKVKGLGLHAFNIAGNRSLAALAASADSSDISYCYASGSLLFKGNGRGWPYNDGTGALVERLANRSSISHVCSFSTSSGAFSMVRRLSGSSVRTSYYVAKGNRGIAGAQDGTCEIVDAYYERSAGFYEDLGLPKPLLHFSALPAMKGFSPDDWHVYVCEGIDPHPRPYLRLFAASLRPLVLGTEQALVESVVAFPNPSVGEVRLKGVPYGRALHLFDLQGRLLRSWRWEERPLSLQGLPAGSYLLQVEGMGSLMLLRE